MIAGFASINPGLDIRILANPGKIVPTGMNTALSQANSICIK
jgi:hypothetical protein